MKHACLASNRLAALFDLHLHPACTWAIKYHTPHYSHCENSFSCTLPFLHPSTPPPPPVSQVYAKSHSVVFVHGSLLTHYVQGVGVVDGSKLVLHQAGVVALV